MSKKLAKAVKTIITQSIAQCGQTPKDADRHAGINAILSLMQADLKPIHDLLAQTELATRAVTEYWDRLENHQKTKHRAFTIPRHDGEAYKKTWDRNEKTKLDPARLFLDPKSAHYWQAAGIAYRYWEAILKQKIQVHLEANDQDHLVFVFRFNNPLRK